MLVRRKADKGVGISNKSVTSSRAQSSTQPQAVSQTKNAINKNRTAKISRYVKLTVATLMVLSIVGSQLAGRVSSESRYVAPQARLDNPIETDIIQPVDQVVAADVAASVAQEADLFLVVGTNLG